MSRQDELRLLIDRDGVVLRRDHPHLAGAVDRMLRCGELVAAGTSCASVDEPELVVTTIRDALARFR